MGVTKFNETMQLIDHRVSDVFMWCNVFIGGEPLHKKCMLIFFGIWKI